MLHKKLLKAMDFKYGNLIIKCHQCGDVQVIEELVTDGRCIYLFNKADSYIRLRCPVCDITMEMCIVPDEEANAEYADEAVKTDEIENEKFQEEGTPAEVV